MKITLKKILAVVLALAVIMCTGASLTANAYYIEYGESGKFEISGTYYGAPGEVSPFDLDDPGVEYDDYVCSVIHYDIGDFVYDDDGEIVGLEGYQNGVAVINVYFYYGEEMVADKYYVFVVSDGEDLGELAYATAYDIEANYKDEGFVSLYLDYESEETPYYCVLVDDTDSPIWIDDGYYYAGETGSGSAIVYVIDAEANVFVTHIKVDVTYSFLQWFIRIFLFGWLWY